MIEITQENLDKEIINSEEIVVVDFWAEWCVPCKQMTPIFEELSKEMKKIKFVKIDVDSNQDLAMKYNIMSVPTFMVLNKGNEVDRFSGSMPKDSFKKKIEEFLE
jgi:thioredoxin 1|tara:strand:- start:52267 stop:52581 length:315 start_codon:yes stop_codon:yes gene_type:complete